MLLLLALAGAAAGAEPDENFVATALARREDWLHGALCPPPAGSGGLDEAASALRSSVDRAPGERATAIYQALTAIIAADARAEACATRPDSTPQDDRRVLTYRDLVSPRDLLAADTLLAAWGEVAAAAAWHRLATVAATPRREPPDPEVCRCMGEAVRGVPVVYGYPTAEMGLWEMLGAVRLGGCDPTAGGPLACPLGCWADRNRPGDELPGPRRVASRAVAGLLLGVAGDGAAVADWDASTAPDPDGGTLAACMGNLTFGQAVLVDHAWTPTSTRLSDLCLVAWAQQHLELVGIDRAAVVRE